ncbi:MAG: DeoR/GlpR family DNA-binding transcription regulator [Bacillota bacterium]
MLPEERKKKIYEIVCKQESVRVSELSRILDTSEATIRRDLEELDERKRVIRTHGGAIAPYSVGRAISSPELITNQVCAAEKKLISQCAYEYIRDDDTIITDSSSTVMELIRLIAQGDRKNLIIVTTSPMNVNILSECKECNVILIGGEYNYTHGTVEGYIANQMIKHIRADKCFIGINGIEESFGYSTPRPVDAELKSLMIKSARNSFILADYTKFGRMYFARVDADVDYLITDSRHGDVSYRWLKNRTHLVYAEEGTSEK